MNAVEKENARWCRLTLDRLILQKASTGSF